MKSLLVTFILSLTLNTLIENSQNQSDYYLDKEFGSCLKWNERKLISDDFKGVPPKNKTVYNAETYYMYDYIDIVTPKDSNKIGLLLFTSFLVNSSWKTDKVINDTLLNHEQRHLDIAEVYCRQLKNEVRKIICQDYSDFVAKYTKLLTKYNDKAIKLNTQYDSETSHGTILNQQKKWDSKIDALLKKYETYANDTVIVRVNKI